MRSASPKQQRHPTGRTSEKRNDENDQTITITVQMSLHYGAATCHLRRKLSLCGTTYHLTRG